MRKWSMGGVLAIGALVGCSSGTPSSGDGGCSQALCGSVCCGAAETCIAYACCPNLQACGSRCCASGAICVSDAGAMSCASLCTTNAQCHEPTPCCSLMQNGSAICAAVSGAQGQQCRCTSGLECDGGCCAPAIDGTGAPVGPYVCKPNDGAKYDCCNPTPTCGAGCCAVDLNGSDICITPCTNDGDCGAAHCKSYTLPYQSTCTTTKGCAP